MKMWNECPRCGSSDIMGNWPNFDGNEVWRRVECRECDFAWNEVFRFVQNEDISTCAVLDDTGQPLDKQPEM